MCIQWVYLGVAILQFHTIPLGIGVAFDLKSVF